MYDLELRELLNHIDGVNRREEQLEQNRYDLARTQATVLLEPYLEKGKRISPEQLWPLPWDEKRSLQDRKEHSQAENEKVLSLFKGWQDKGLIKANEQ